MANRAAQLDAETKQRHPQATVKRRGRNFIEHDLGDGVTRWTGTIEPLHTRADSTPIDTAWVADASPWSYRVSAADYTSRIKTAFNGAPLLQYTDVVTGAWVTLQPQQLNWTNDSNSVQMISAVQGVTAQLNDDLVRWPGAYGTGRDFEYQNHPKRLIKRLVLQSALPAPSASILSGANPALQLQFIFNWSANAAVWIDGALWNKSTAKITANRIEFRVGDTTVFWFDAPTAYDATGENYAPGVMLRVRKAGNKLYVEVRTPYAWLQGAAYPVVVDPTLTLQEDDTDSIDTFVSQAAPTTAYNTSLSIFCRGETNQGRTPLILWDISSIPSTATITAATQYLWLQQESITADNTVTVSAILSANSGWIEAATWDYADGAGESDRWAGDTDNNGGSDAGCTVSGTDYNSSALGSFVVINGSDADTEFSCSLSTAQVQAWLTNNYGECMHSPAQVIVFRSSSYATSGYRPKLVVEYTAAGNPWYAYVQQ